MVVFIEMPFDYCSSQFSGGVRSSLGEEPQKFHGEPLSQNASFVKCPNRDARVCEARAQAATYYRGGGGGGGYVA